MWFNCGPSLSYHCVIELKVYNLYSLGRVLYYFTLQLLGAFSVFLIIRAQKTTVDNVVESRRIAPGRPLRPVMAPLDLYGGGQDATNTGTVGVTRLKARQIEKETGLLRRKIYVFLGLWSIFGVLTPAAHFANVFTRGQPFPFGSLTFLFITLDYLFCERFYACVTHALRLNGIKEKRKTSVQV
jgi:hypothetical protein